MPFNKISAQSNLGAPVLPVSVPAGGVFMLPVGQGQVGAYGSVLYPQLGTGNPLTGQYIVQLGQYTTLQVYDYQLNYWRDINVAPNALVTVSADGANFRIANTTGCPVGALITSAGSAGVNGFYGYNALGAAQTIVGGVVTASNGVFTITPSAGGSLWNAIVGGAVNTTVGVSGTLYNNGPFGGTGASVTGSGGSSYTRPPIIVFTPPPNQGSQPYILPAATSTLSGGAVNAVTVTQQGAGLLGLPGIVVIPQPGDITGSGAILGWTSGNSSMVGTGTVLALWPSYYGTALTAVPTFVFAGTANPAPSVTAIMNFTITGVGGSGGTGYGTTPGGVINGGIVAGSAANTNALFDKALSIPIYPPLTITTATGVPALSGPFGGVNFQAVPTFAAIPNGTSAPSGANASTFTVGGAGDTILFMSI